MSPRRAFNRFMVDVENGSNLKLLRLSDSEYRCLMAGVLPIAAKSVVRGCLLVGDCPATVEDVANQARKPVSAARRAMEKLRELGIVFFDAEIGCERVHDFEDWNPSPKKDATNAERQKRFRERQARNGTVTAPVTAADRYVTASEVEEEVEEEGGVVLSLAVAGRASAAKRTNPLTDDAALAEHIQGILQRTIHGLQGDQRCKTPTAKRILAVIRRERLTSEQAVAVAIQTRCIAQAQDRAPNIEALFAKKAADHREEGAA